jgi:RimJ/RimL family protein N-acetyltransferase
VDKSHSSWTPFISPAVAQALLVVGVGLTVWRIRRHRGTTVDLPDLAATPAPTEPALVATPALPVRPAPVEILAPTSSGDSRPIPASPVRHHNDHGPIPSAGLTPILLEGDRVRLEPLGPEHIEGLAAAAAEDRSTYRFTWVPDGLEATEAYVAEAHQEWEAGRCLPFAVIDRRDGRPVGSTRIYDWGVLPSNVAPSDGDPPNVSEIGHTWYGHAAQRSGINVEGKLLLLTHLFETWPGVRVTLKTDARNQRSFTAIERLGAHYEGIRRAHMAAADGTIRDTAYFSIVAADWPEAKATILSRLR